jgi:hypothetical protein
MSTASQNLDAWLEKQEVLHGWVHARVREASGYDPSRL